MATVKIIELDETNTCKICDNALAKYSCPKCNILYCSLECYQSSAHLECSESFYKDNIIEELNIDKDNNESKQKMLDILQRVHADNQILFSDNEDEFGECSGFTLDDDFLNFCSGQDDEQEIDSDDDADLLDIGDRLAGVNLDDAEQVWGKLTEDEKQEFVAFLKSEDVANLIPSWKPWWLYYNKMVEEVESADEFKKDCPEICKIKEFSELTSKVPDESVQYNLINVLAAYAFTTRYFNGEHYDFAYEAVSCLGTISLALKVGQVFTDFESAVMSVEQECINSDWIMSDNENIQTMREDIEKILKGPGKSDPKYYVLCALSDVKNLLKTSAEAPPKSGETSGAFSKQFPNEHFPSVKFMEPQQIKSCVKKMDFFLSYTKEYFNS
ncbi:unnamed protein product [Phyllotreta striolata]|uniref:HIT-type domain-containing protein n=1 Tax=Phyllotreta striolata TaxID=444603 RepID=A0A9N9TQT8_PHYSR|nr:unnamed protein product [Phyllotreta striolata]